MNFDKRESVWNIKIGEITHKISLIQKAVKTDYSLYVDDELLSSLKISRWFNYEYKFEIDGNSCSIVKLLKEDNARIAVNGEYIDKDIEYVPVPPPSVFSKMIIILNMIVFLGVAVFSMFGNYNLIYKIIFVEISFGFFIFIEKLAGIVLSNPVNKKDKSKNIISNMIFLIAEIVYIVVLLYLLKVFYTT